MYSLSSPHSCSDYGYITARIYQATITPHRCHEDVKSPEQLQNVINPLFIVMGPLHLLLQRPGGYMVPTYILTLSPKEGTMFKGSFVALLTPFKNGDVDKSSFKSFVEWQIAEGTHGLVPCGTTGESPTLSHDEHDEVVELCIEAANGRVPVVAGAGSNSTAEAIRLTKNAKRAGADAALIVTPYYLSLIHI